MDPRQHARLAVIGHIRQEAGIGLEEGSAIHATITNLDLGETGWTASAISNAHTDKTYLVSHNTKTGVTIVNEYTKSSETRTQLPTSDEDEAPASDYHGSNIDVHNSRGFQIGKGNVQHNRF